MMSIKQLWWKIALALLLVLIIVLYIYLRPYHPDAAALQAMQSTEDVSVSQEGQAIIFEPKAVEQPSVIFYPGGLVEPESYAPLARQLAASGHRTYIVRMPFHLAIFGGSRAAQILSYPHAVDETFVIGGHSLGGVMASRFAASHQDRIAGVFFLASYADPKGSLAGSNMPVLSLIGSNDGAVNPDSFAKAKSYLPASAEFITIEGGNHSQFGSYGLQKGDRPAAITPEEQLSQTVRSLLQWLGSTKAATAS